MKTNWKDIRGLWNVKAIHLSFKSDISIAKINSQDLHKIRINHTYWKLLQDVSCWSVQSKSALRGRRIHNFIELWCLVGPRGLKIWVSSTSFQKSSIGWPQQSPTERALKFNMIFHDSTNKLFSSQHYSRAKFKNLDATEVLSSDFSGLKAL